MPEAEKRKTDPDAAYGDQKAQSDFMSATSPVATPQVPQNEPQAFPPITPQAYAPEAAQAVAPPDMLVGGRDLDPDEAQILFGGNQPGEADLAELDVSWLPAFAELADDTDLPDELRSLGLAARRMLEDQDASS